MFDHERSERVDVFPNPDGEFIQIWDSPWKTPGRRLLLSYVRAPDGPRDINHRVYLEDGPFEIIETNDHRRTFHYRDGGEPRLELFLPCGRLLVNDPRNGLTIRSVFTASFDWDKRVPVGKPLSDRPVLRLQTEGGTWYVSTYQEAAGGSSILWLVEEHEGSTLKKVVEIGPGT